MKKRKLRLGLIGTGFMGKAHSNAYRQVTKFFELDFDPVLSVVCARDQGRLKAFQDKWGWESCATDWRRVVEQKDVDVIDIATPNNTHLEIAVAAAEAGKIVLCEKPLAKNAEEGRKMVEAVEEARVANMVWFNYRRLPAVALARQIVDDGRLGRVFHYRSKYLQDWTMDPDLPQGGRTFWRLDGESAGSGVTGDLLSHSIDLALWLIGEISSVASMTSTFVTERKLQDEPETVRSVTIDDACAFIARFKNSAMGVFESSRHSRGRKNQSTFEINGQNASVAFDIEDGHRLSYYDCEEPSRIRGWHSIQVADSDHPYVKNYWVSGIPIGYEHTFINTVADFLRGLSSGQKTCPDFRDALSTQMVCDAVLESARLKNWQQIS